MKHIEFLGLPGVGKTTLAHELIRLLRMKQEPVFSWKAAKRNGLYRLLKKKKESLQKIFMVLLTVPGSRIQDVVWSKYQYELTLRFIHQYPQLVCWVVEYANSLDLPSQFLPDRFSEQKLIEWFFNFASFYQLADAQLDSDAILISEEGFCQQLYNFLVVRRGGFDMNDVESYLQLIPKPELVVSILADPKQCEKRMRERSKGFPAFFHAFESSDIVDLLEKRLLLHEKMLNYLKTQNVLIVTVNNTDYSYARQDLERIVTLCIQDQI